MQHNSGPKTPRNPLQPEAIGDSSIVWNSGLGDPSALGAGYNYDAYFVDGNLGVQLSNESAGSIGSLYWEKNYDYSNDLYIKMTIHGYHTGGNGGNGYTLFLGSLYSDSQINDASGSINVFFNENLYGDPNTDAVSLFVNGSKVGGEGANYFTGESLDDYVSRTVEVLFQHQTEGANYITVFMDAKYICKVNVGSWTPGGNFIGVTASSDGDSSYVNNHYIKSFEVRSIVPWISVNYPIKHEVKDKIYIMINDNYVDYVADPAGIPFHEPNNIMAYLDDQMIEYETFTDISEAGWTDAAGKAGYIMIPELEEGNLLPDLTAGAKSKINGFVSSGGKLLMFCPGSGDLVNVLNDIFSFSLSMHGASEPINQTVAGVALFPSESANIPSNNGSDSLDTSTLPPEAVTIYEGNGANQSVVTMIPYGSGKIYVLGWDWFDAVPLGGQDGGYNHLLQSILKS